MNDEMRHLRVSPVATRAIPADLFERFGSEPDIVEELSDGLRARLGIESSIDFKQCTATGSVGVHVGTIVTVRYVPKCRPSDDQRLGHDAIAAALPRDAIVVVDARGCEGSVLGGVGAAILRTAGASVYIVDGMIRDAPEIHITGLRVIARSVGIRSGRPLTQVVEIGGQVVVMDRLATSGDTGIVNASGLVAVPAWLGWDDVRRALAA